MWSRLSTWTLIVALAGAPTLAYGDDDLTSLSYISYLERYATVSPANGDETLDVQVNMPILVGDRLDTARGARVEVQLADGCVVWVDEFTTLDFDAIALSRDIGSRRTVLNIVSGGIAIEIPATATVDENLRVDSRRGSVFLSRPGLYRLTVKRDELHVETHAGLAELPLGMGSSMLRAGQQAWIEDDEDDPDITRAALDDDLDDFWAWVEERRNPRSGSQASRHIEGRHGTRAAVLDTYGEWVYLSTYSTWAWRPRVSVTWRPYSLGRWYWTPVGWHWISYEPWGWYPYHYGSWYWDVRYGWVWCWDWVWGPAWVHWMWADGYIGWCPRGYYDWWYWDRHRHHYHGRWPDRWSHAAFDFSGRVRLREIDPRPWTFVPGDRFGSQHIDRVRVDTERLLREVGDRSEGFVRSGPLVTRTPERGLPDRGVGEIIRRGVGERDTPDLGPILRRDAEGLARTPGARTVFDPTRTEDLAVRTLPDRGEELPLRGGGRSATDRGELGGRVRSDRPEGGPTAGRDTPGRTLPSRDLGRVVPPTSGQVPSGGTPPERSVQRPGRGDRYVPEDRSNVQPGSGRESSSRSGPGRPEAGSRPDSNTTRSDPPSRSAPPPRSDPPARSDPPSQPNQPARSDPPPQPNQPARPDPPRRPDSPERQRMSHNQRAYELPDRSAYRLQDTSRAARWSRDEVSFRARTQPGPEASRHSGRSDVTWSGASGQRGGFSRQLPPSSRSRSEAVASHGGHGGSARSVARSPAEGSGRSGSPPSSARSWSASSSGTSSTQRSYSSSGSTGVQPYSQSLSPSSSGGSSSRSSSGSSARSSGNASSSGSRSSSGTSSSSRGSSGSPRHR